MFVILKLLTEKQSMRLRIMMNCDVIKSFIFQLKTKNLILMNSTFQCRNLKLSIILLYARIRITFC